MSDMKHSDKHIQVSVLTSALLHKSRSIMSGLSPSIARCRAVFLSHAKGTSESLLHYMQLVIYDLLQEDFLYKTTKSK